MSNEPTDVRAPCELLPCPYCGRAARYVAEDYVDNSLQPWPFAECDACNTGAPVEFWNKRAQQADQQGEPVFRDQKVTELAEFMGRLSGGLRHFAGQIIDAGWQKIPTHQTDQQGEPVAWIKPDVAETLTKDECCHAFGSQNPKGSLIPRYRHAQPATAKVDEKAEFELWADRHFASADYSCNYAGVYLKDWMRHSFAAWQARAKLNTPQ